MSCANFPPPHTALFFLPPTPDFKIFLPQSARELQALMQWRNLLLHPLQKIARGAVTTSPGDDRLLSYVVPSRLDVHYVSALWLVRKIHSFQFSPRNGAFDGLIWSTCRGGPKDLCRWKSWKLRNTHCYALKKNSRQRFLVRGPPPTLHSSLMQTNAVVTIAIQLRYDHSTTHVTTGLLHCGLDK